MPTNVVSSTISLRPAGAATIYRLKKGGRLKYIDRLGDLWFDKLFATGWRQRRVFTVLVVFQSFVLGILLLTCQGISLLDSLRIIQS